MPFKILPLTFEQTRGTKTYHLPFFPGGDSRKQRMGSFARRTTSRPTPHVTLMIKRVKTEGAELYQAGLVVCELDRPFTKLEGRKRAFDRLTFQPVEADTPELLVAKLTYRLVHLAANRPNTVADSVFLDLEEIGKNLIEAFDRMDRNREEKLAKEAEKAAKVAIAGN